MPSTDVRQAAGTASGGSRRIVSGDDALLTTAREARTVRPPRSRTPVWAGGSAGQGELRLHKGSTVAPPFEYPHLCAHAAQHRCSAPPSQRTDCAAALHQHLVDVGAQAQAAAVLLQPPHQRIHHGLAASPGELEHAVWLVPLLKHEGNLRCGTGGEDGTGDRRQRLSRRGCHLGNPLVPYRQWRCPHRPAPCAHPRWCRRQAGPRAGTPAGRASCG